MFLISLIIILVNLKFSICVENISTNALQFPPNFKFGVATASFQIEGGWNASGKSENIWDRFIHKNPDVVKDKSNGDVACDSYHLYPQDVDILKNLSVDFYRFSFSWTRLLPSGFVNSRSEEGEKYYNSLIDMLLTNNIKPWVTLYHWDLPQKLQELGGWANPLMATYFKDYANYAFSTFGDRVKTWITFNEPVEICSSGYGEGDDAPAYKQSGIADYLCGKTILIAHARAYRIYDFHYRKKQNGVVGITINSEWNQPATLKMADFEASERNLQMNFGWWAHPIFHKRGDYPDVMKQRISNISCEENYPSSRLPALSEQEVKLIRGTFDFLGLNHYTTRLVADYAYPNTYPTSRKKDIGVKLTSDAQWKTSPVLSWLKVVPWGLRKLLVWIKKEYNNPLVYITENGYADKGDIDDKDRIKYLKDYMKSILQAIYLDDCNVNAYTVWSLMDNMEWREGYVPKFGLFSVDFDSPEKNRTARKSASFYENVINTRQLTTVVCVPIVEFDDNMTTFGDAGDDATQTTPYCPTLPVTNRTVKTTKEPVTEEEGTPDPLLAAGSAAVSTNEGETSATAVNSAEGTVITKGGNEAAATNAAIDTTVAAETNSEVDPNLAATANAEVGEQAQTESQEATVVQV